MAKNIQTKLQSRNRMARPGQITKPDPTELKSIVRDGLVSMTMADREEFIQALEAEMRRVNLNMRAYLIPLGIPGRSPEDLTPTEVGHLIRFLRINVPQATAVVDKTIARYGIFEKAGQSDDRIAA